MSLLKRAGSVCGARATGTMILVEMLTAQESMGTVLSLGTKTKAASPQGYIIDVGPALKAEEWGFKVGDRVLLQGQYVPVPWNRHGTERELGIVMAHDIKCVLQEDSDCCSSTGCCSIEQ
jgi:hypothetical protein